MCLKAKKIKIKINGKQKKGDKLTQKGGGFTRSDPRLKLLTPFLALVPFVLPQQPRNPKLQPHFARKTEGVAVDGGG